ncbi:hypothetical protein KAU55_00645, partial [Candidatus Bathyarchaeota archaeon]|nr:hypothetical protein [Candidatus Bathyarchaeota archaeon]
MRKFTFMSSKILIVSGYLTLKLRVGSFMELLELFRPLISADNKFIREWKRRNKPVLGYACSYTPEEIIYAGGILPIRVLGSLEPP